MSTALTPNRLRVFRVLTVAIPIVFFLLLEGGLRFWDYGPNLDLFIPAELGAGGEAYLRPNPDVALRYFHRVNRAPEPRDELFLADKPRDGYRVFMMGGSTVAGFPYDENAMVSRILDRRLSDAFPDRTIEVVNLGIAAINSFALLDFVDEVLGQRPDAVLIYAGHNEFYGAMGAASVESPGSRRWIVNAYLGLLHSRLVRLTRDLVLGFRRWTTGAEDLETYERTYPTLMSRVVASDVPYDDEVYRIGVTNFRLNLDEIASRFSDAGIPVLLSELVSNLRDMPPFLSGRGEPQPAAAEAFEEARALESAADFDAARVAYARARDLDGLRFRAPGDFNIVIHEIAQRYGIPVVPMNSRFESASPNGLIGSSLMLEHLHPNTDGYFLMAEAFFEAMRTNGFVEEHWDSDRIREAGWYSQRWPVTDLDRELGRLRVLDLMDYWPFRPPGEPGTAFADYEPSSRVESVAYRVVSGRLDVLDARLELAEWYRTEGNPASAEREYQAVIAGDPLRCRTRRLPAPILSDPAFDPGISC